MTCNRKFWQGSGKLWNYNETTPTRENKWQQTTICRSLLR